MATTLDIEESTSISQNKDGIRIERVAIVTGVTGSASAKLNTALNDAQMPDFGDVHPDVSGIYLNDISGQVIDNETIKFVLSYYNDPSTSDGGETTSRASGSTVIEEINSDINGDRFSAAYSNGVASINEAFSAEVERPRVTFDFTFTTSAFPKTTIDTYLGKINSVIWNSYPVKTILCTAVNTEQQDDNYKVRISFSYNPDTWVFIGKTAWAPPIFASTPADSGLNLSTGLKTFEVYAQVDFSPLSLSL
jgi:hypothetical protein